MRILLQTVAIALAFVSISSAQEVAYDQFDVKGLPNSPKSAKNGYAVVLIDSGLETLQVAAAATVPDTVDSIESAQLLVLDKEGKLVARALLLPFKLGEQSSSTLEFNLRRELLEKSYILIKTRKGDTVTVAKVLLGTFHVSTREGAIPKK